MLWNYYVKTLYTHFALVCQTKVQGGGGSEEILIK